MSLLSVDASWLVFLGSATGVALLGSWHCVGMCGPLAALAKKKSDVVLYQVGRLMTYVALGALAALFGRQLLSLVPDAVKWVGTVILGILAFWILLSSWNLELPRRFQRFLWTYRPRQTRSLDMFSLGALTGLLPCHWLYGFVVIAAGQDSPAKGALLLFALWVGSAPWLLGASSVSGLIQRLSPRSRWLTFVLLAVVMLGLMAHGFMSGDEHLGCKLPEL